MPDIIPSRFAGDIGQVQKREQNQLRTLAATAAEPMRIAKLSGSEALADIRVEWEALDAQIFPRTPFTSPLWIGLWWNHLRRQRPLLRDEFFCHTVRDADGRLVAIAPLMVTVSPGFGPPWIRVVQFFGSDPGITELRGVICH